MSYYYQHLNSFANRTVEEFDPSKGITTAVGTAIALRHEYDDPLDVSESLALLIEDPLASKLEALVIGAWKELLESGKDSSEVVNALIEVADRLPNLKALYIGDILSEEYEISWIEQSNLSPLLSAYPDLTWLQVRGGSGLKFSPVTHPHLKTLIIETGGLSPETIADICQLKLPNLEHLELWLGSECYGGESTIEDLQPILNGNLYPKLRYLGLRNAEYTDDIAEDVVRSLTLKQLKILDLSMGTLGIRGAKALWSCPGIKTLDTLNVSESYLSQEDIQKLQQLNIQILADDQKEDDYEEEEEEEYRYCSVSE
jgi:hypothetical protein